MRRPLPALGRIATGKKNETLIIIKVIIIMIIINCNLVVTRWQWLFYMYTKQEVGYF